jgi:DNA-binding MarR family transcriptional regulator
MEKRIRSDGLLYADDFAKLWMRFTKNLKMHMETELSPGLTEGQLNLLELLRAQPRMKPSDFVEHLTTTPAAVTTLLDRMEKNGLIVRERDERDRRIVWITVTDKGAAECERGTLLRKSFMDEHLNQISAHNQQLLVYLLGKVASL